MGGRKLWAVGEEMLQADFQGYVADQVVAVFADTTARDTWASPPNGAVAITTDTNTRWQRIGGAWQRFAPYLAGSNTNTSDTSAYPSTGNLLAVTFTAVASHQYHVIADCQYGAASGSGSMTQVIRLDGTTDLNVRAETWGATNAGPAICSQAISTPSAGSRTIAVLATASASGLYFQDGILTVVDLGLA